MASSNLLRLWKKRLQVEHFGVSQIRLLTIADSAKRFENMLSALDEITAGKGSNFFLFVDQDEQGGGTPLEVASARTYETRLLRIAFSMSALPLIATTERTCQHVSNVPEAEVLLL
jgi:hypothetical protein